MSRRLRLEDPGLHQHGGEVEDVRGGADQAVLEGVERGAARLYLSARIRHAEERPCDGAFKRPEEGRTIAVDERGTPGEAHVGEGREPVPVHLRDRLTSSHEPNGWAFEDAVG